MERRYLKWYHKLGYGSGDIAGNVVYAFLSSFVMFYLTDYVGMNMGIVGTLMAVSKIFDGVSDFFFGNLIDKTKTKMGKARPWMIFGYIGCAVALIATFSIPESWRETAQYVYFFISYTMLNAVFFTANNIAYASLTALITKNTKERVELGSIRFIFAFSTSLLIQTVTVGMVDWLGGGTAGWKWVAVIYSVIGLVVNTVSGLSVKEIEELDDEMDREWEEEHKLSFISSVKLLLSNKYYIIICCTYLFTQLYTTMLSMGIFYMKYILGSEDYFPVFSWFINIPLIIGLIVSPIIINKLGSMYKINVLSYAVATLGRIMVIVSAYYGSIIWMLVFTGISALGTSPLQGDLNALIASCSEFTTLKTGKRIDGMMYSCSSLGIKIGGGIGTAVCGWLLDAAGYIKDAAQQTASAVSMLNFIYLWAPAILCLGVTVLLSFLKVEKANKQLKEYKTQLTVQ